MGDYLVKVLKSALLGATFLAGASLLAGANAADVYSRGGSLKDGPVADYRPAITWTGFYIGAHIGSTFDDTIEIDGFEEEIDENFLAGVHVGYNWQTAGNLVFGLEGSWSFLTGDEIEGDDVIFVDAEDNWLASIRARLGYAAGSTLLYATGGVAFLDSDLYTDTSVGWVAGLGLDHKLRDNVSIGLEGLYYSFDDESDFDLVDDVERDFWTIQARLTYHLGGHSYDGLK